MLLIECIQLHLWVYQIHTHTSFHFISHHIDYINTAIQIQMSLIWKCCETYTYLCTVPTYLFMYTSSRKILRIEQNVFLWIF